MLEEKQEAMQESKMTRRALFRFLGLGIGSLVAALGAALITKVTVPDHEVQAQAQWEPCAPQEDKCRPWAKFT